MVACNLGVLRGCMGNSKEGQGAVAHDLLKESLDKGHARLVTQGWGARSTYLSGDVSTANIVKANYVTHPQLKHMKTIMK